MPGLQLHNAHVINVESLEYKNIINLLGGEWGGRVKCRKKSTNTN